MSLQEIVALGKVLSGNAHQVGRGQSTVSISKAQAAITLWNYAHCSSDARTDIIRVGCLSSLCQLVERGNKDEKYACIGCLQRLVDDSSLLQDFSQQQPVIFAILKAAVVALDVGHWRAKLCATRILLALLSLNDNHLTQRIQNTIPQLIHLVSQKDHNWAALFPARISAFKIIKHLIEFRQNQYQINNNKDQIFSFIILLVDNNVIGPLLGAAMSGDMVISNLGIICLRRLIIWREFDEQLLRSGFVSNFLCLLAYGSDEQKGHVCGCLLELSMVESWREVFVQKSVIHAMIKLIQRYIGKEQKKSSKKKKVQLGGQQCGIVSNACGVLYQLTFTDLNKKQMRDAGAIPVLLNLLDQQNTLVYKNAVATLWNLSMDQESREALESSKAPEFLQQSIPDRWIASDLSPDKLPEYNSEEDVGFDEDEMEEDTKQTLKLCRMRGLISFRDNQVV